VRAIKKLNNNVALALNDKNEEVIIVGKGVGFAKMPYELTDLAVIEKTYVIPKNMTAYKVLESIPAEIIDITERIIEYGSHVCENEINLNIFLPLSDHIYFAVQRKREGFATPNPLQWEIRHLYPGEYKIGVKALEIIREKTGLLFDNAEAAFIALHFANAQIGPNDQTEATRITSTVGQILIIIKECLNISFDEESPGFARFLTHIRYFVIRQINGTSLKNENEDMYNIITKRRPQEVECVRAIEKYLKETYGWVCSDEEKLYLILHMQRMQPSHE
jgi:beta-glucoside operon transcriptional antiterminator